MATVYIKFSSSSEQVHSDDCTTRWDDDIRCSIPMSGLYEEKYTNLMKIIGDEEKIDEWVAENNGKVEELSETEINVIGQSMVPEGTIRTIEEIGDDNRLYRMTYTAGEFTMSDGQDWTLTNQEDITPE